MLDMMKKERDIFERRSIYHILVPASLNIKDHTAFSLLLLLLLLLLQWFNVCLQWKHSGIWFHYVFFSNCSFRVEKASKGSFKCNLRPHWGMHSYPNSVCFHSFTLKEPLLMQKAHWWQRHTPFEEKQTAFHQLAPRITVSSSSKTKNIIRMYSFTS